MDKKIEFTADEFKKIEKVVNDFLQNGGLNDPPKFVILTGPIASGKTTVRNEKYSKDYVLVKEDRLEEAKLTLLKLGLKLIK